MHRSPTQSQIAAKLGVSQALVSRALSGRAGEIGAAPQTVEKIRRMAAEWNYAPSATALALLGAPTRTVGVVVKNFDDPYFGRLIGGLQSQARAHGHSLLLTGSGLEDFAALRKHRVDAVILAGSDFLPEGLADFAGEEMPVIQIGTGPVLPGAVQIHMDEAAGMRAMVGVLTEWGHRRFGFVGREVGANLRRRDALNRALEGMGVPWAAAFVFGSEKHDGHEAERVVAKFLKTSEPPTVLVAGEDAIALALLRAFSEAGVSVPNDLSLVGIDDIAASAQAIPPLTTLRQPIPDMAAAAFRVLSGKQKKYPISIPGELIVRKSCSRPKIS